MSDSYSYNDYLSKECNPAEISRLSNYVFKEGHLEAVDDLLLEILPLANVIYYKYIKYLDDDYYAKDDLISEAVLQLYQDVVLRWDKYINVTSYYYYFSMLLRNGMIGLVHEYHNYYNQDELDPNLIDGRESETDIYDRITYKILRDSVTENIITTSKRILSCRTRSTNLLLAILESMYVKKESLDNLRSRVKVLGVTNTLFNFYVEHVTYVYRLAYNYQYAIIGGNKKMISRISSTIDRFEDTTYKILSFNYYDSIIPEIYAEFGADVAKKFVKTFSGRTVQVPAYKGFCEDLLGGAVIALCDGNKENLYKLSEDYKISYKMLLSIYNRASKYVKSSEEEK